VQDDVADLVLSIFAPKNFAEFARVLRPGGWLAVVYPGAVHLIELRRRFGLIGQAERKTTRYAEAAQRHVGPAVVTTLASRVLLDAGAIRDAVLMGPNARHVDPAMIDDNERPLWVTLDFAILFARKTR
jgi:23S rRNA (guanine745-N1)-methyltransferase